ncbi:hypothetical protein ACMZ8K_03490 [Gardnerella swidsinskii]|uniref:hypothetical protein n=1 Tax=Gardnerella swidsinskii TaxID=2792979 RepID=UPI00259040A6|nr:hypothetical protein [uncultured Gardnerella sp.]
MAQPVLLCFHCDTPGSLRTAEHATYHVSIAQTSLVSVNPSSSYAEKPLHETMLDSVHDPSHDYSSVLTADSHAQLHSPARSLVYS